MVQATQQVSAVPQGEKEEAALAGFRKRLELKPDVEKQLRAGGEPGLLGTSGYDDLTLLRWLRAESGSVDKAEKRLVAHAQWRATFVPNGVISESEIPKELGAKKAYLQGTDKQGRSLSVVICSRHSRSKRNIEECRRFICYTLDAAVEANDSSRNPAGRTCALFDLRNLGLDCLDNSVLKSCFELLQAHYPERLSMLWMYEAPTIFWGLWQVVSPFIDKVTREKIKFVYGKDGLAELQAAIDPEVLPKEFGGQADLILVQDYRKQLLADLQKANGAATF